MSGDTGRHMLRGAGGALLAVGLLLVLGRCDLAEPVNRQSLVVEAFLKTDRSLPTITLRQTRPLNDPADKRANAAQGATVELILDGDSISYTETEQRPGGTCPPQTLKRCPLGSRGASRCSGGGQRRGHTARPRPPSN